MSARCGCLANARKVPTPRRGGARAWFWVRKGAWLLGGQHHGQAGASMDAMDRHPDKVIVLLDVDCRVLGDLSPLAEIGGDVGFHIRTKYRRSGGMRFGARSGTVVVRPTAGARAYVQAWITAAAELP